MLSPCWPNGREESAKLKRVAEGNLRSDEDAKRMRSSNRCDFTFFESLNPRVGLISNSRALS